jgi:predicted RNase H-like HicB family nuclease
MEAIDVNELRKYCERPYTMTVRKISEENEAYFVAEISELPGCKSVGDTCEEAIASLNEAKELWIQDAMEHHEHIPEPVNYDASGKLLIRIPKSLHVKLIEGAQLDGTSINQYVVFLLSRRETVHEVERVMNKAAVRTSFSVTQNKQSRPIFKGAGVQHTQLAEWQQRGLLIGG